MGNSWGTENGMWKVGSRGWRMRKCEYARDDVDCGWVAKKALHWRSLLSKGGTPEKERRARENEQTASNEKISERPPKAFGGRLAASRRVLNFSSRVVLNVLLHEPPLSPPALATSFLLGSMDLSFFLFLGLDSRDQRFSLIVCVPRAWLDPLSLSLFLFLRPATTFTGESLCLFSFAIFRASLSILVAVSRRALGAFSSSSYSSSSLGPSEKEEQQQQRAEASRSRHRSDTHRSPLPRKQHREQRVSLLLHPLRPSSSSCFFSGRRLRKGAASRAPPVHTTVNLFLSLPRSRIPGPAATYIIRRGPFALRPVRSIASRFSYTLLLLYFLFRYSHPSSSSRSSISPLRVLCLSSASDTMHELATIEAASFTHHLVPISSPRLFFFPLPFPSHFHLFFPIQFDCLALSTQSLALVPRPLTGSLLTRSSVHKSSQFSRTPFVYIR